MTSLKGKTPSNCNLTLYLPPVLLNILNDMGIKKGLSRSSLVRTAVREYIMRELKFDEYFNKEKTDDIIIDALIKAKTGKIIINGKEFKKIGEA